MINRRIVPRPKALWKQIQDSKEPPKPKFKTPQKPRQAIKAKRPYIRGISKAQAARNREYRKIEQWFLKDHPWCMVCGRPSRYVHHFRGKKGPLLFDTRFYVPVCELASCHTNGIHANIDQSRELCLLCQKGEWDRLPRDGEEYSVPRTTPLGPGFLFQTQLTKPSKIASVE